MIRWRLILIAVGALLVPISGAGAQGMVSPFSTDNSKQPQAKKPVQGTSPQIAAPARAALGAGAVSRTDVYRIGPLDVLEVSVFGVPELSGPVVVSDYGNIQLPLLGETHVAGKTTEELQQDLTAKLGADYLQNPQVRVTVKEFNSRAVTVSGAIGKPGVYPLKGETTLLQVVVMAGGFKDESDATVLILRNNGGKRSGARFDVSAIERGQANDPFVQPGDTIVAGESTIKKAYQGVLKALPLAGAFALF